MRQRIPVRNYPSTLFWLLSLAALLLAPALATASGVHPEFNFQSTTESPFPSDRFTVTDNQQNTGLRVNLPSPNCTTHPSDCRDVTLLNQLDGFSTKPRLSIPFDGAIDPATVTSDTIFLLRLGDLAPNEARKIGINQVVWDPATLTLFLQSDEHLDQNTSYLLVVTNGVLDAAGDPIEASDSFAHFRRNMSYGQTKDAQLKIYRKELIEVLDEEALESLSPGLSPNTITAATVFTTGSVTATLEKIRDQIKAAPAPVANFNLGTLGQRTVFPISSVLGVAFGRQVSTAGPLVTSAMPLQALQGIPGAVGSIAFGKFSAMNFETAGRFIPAVPTRTGVPAVQSTQDIYFNLFLPSGTRPANGWPVAIFGHGFGDNKNNSPVAVAASMAAQGIATIEINAVGHGAGPNSTLTVLRSALNGGPVALSAGGRGIDIDGNGVIGSTEGFFAVGNEVDIASRDGINQTVADLMQVVRTIQGGVDVDGNGSVALDSNRIYYIGQSLGGIYGTVLLGVEPDINTGALNVPGGTLTDISRFNPSFRVLLGALLAPRVPSLINIGGLSFNDNMPLRNQPPVINTVAGAIDIQTYEDQSNWLAQSGDPVAWAPFIRKSPLPGQASKNVIVQIARGDKTVPNPTNTALIRSGDLTDRTTMFRNDLAFPLGVGFFTNPHTFLTDLAGTVPVRTVAVQAQTQIATFLASGGVVTIDPDGAGVLFETPINGPLPEDLAFIP
jgi:hypothetical protein